MSKLTIKSPAPIGLADIAEQAAHSVEMMSQIRAAMLSPTTHKAAPIWNLSQLAQLLNMISHLDDFTNFIDKFIGSGMCDRISHVG